MVRIDRLNVGRDFRGPVRNGSGVATCSGASVVLFSSMATLVEADNLTQHCPYTSVHWQVPRLG